IGSPQFSASLAPARPLASKQPHQDRQHHAYDDARDDREIERRAAAADDDVARQTADRQAQHDQRADAGDDEPDDNEQPAPSSSLSILVRPATSLRVRSAQ